MRRKLGWCPHDVELRTLEEYQRRHGNCALWRCGGRCRGGGLDGSQLGPSISVTFACAAAPCALTLACVGWPDWCSRKCCIGELELCRIGRVEYHDILHNGESRGRGMMRPDVTREYREREKKGREREEVEPGIWNVIPASCGECQVRTGRSQHTSSSDEDVESP
jgi:hypothetical protein